MGLLEWRESPCEELLYQTDRFLPWKALSVSRNLIIDVVPQIVESAVLINEQFDVSMRSVYVELQPTVRARENVYI